MVKILTSAGTIILDDTTVQFDDSVAPVFKEAGLMGNFSAAPVTTGPTRRMALSRRVQVR